MIELLLAGIGGLVLLALVDHLIARPEHGVLVAMASAVTTAFFTIAPSVLIGGFNISSGDVVMGLAAAVVTARLLRGQQFRGNRQAPFLVLALVVWSLARGVAENELTFAINQARPSLWIFTLAVYALVIPTDLETRLAVRRYWLMGCAALLAIAVGRWVIVVAGLPTGAWYDQTYAGLRTLWSGPTMVLAQGYLMLLPEVLRGEASTRHRIACATLGTAVLILQHRSVWAVLIVATAYLVKRSWGSIDRQLLVSGTAVLVLVCGGSFAAIQPQQLVRAVTVSEAANLSTFEWRVQGWVDLLELAQPDGFLEGTVGRSFGSPWRRDNPDTLRDVAPHNMYIEQMIRIGALGLGLLLAMGIRAASALRRPPPWLRTRSMGAQVFLALLLAQAVYSLPYGLYPEQGILLGYAVALGAAARESGGESTRDVAAAQLLGTP